MKQILIFLFKLVRLILALWGATVLLFLLSNCISKYS